jgi:hypothetical protein
MHMVLVWGGICFVAGLAYLASPRFVRWTLDNDRTGQRWARWLGMERAPAVLRFVFGPILIVGGVVLIVIGLGWV